MEKIGMSLKEKIGLFLLIFGEAMIISYIENKLCAFVLAVGLSLSILCPYNAIKTIEAYFSDKENISNPKLISIVLFIVGFALSSVAVYLIFNTALAYAFLLFYHLSIAFVTIPLFDIINKSNRSKHAEDVSLRNTRG